MGLPGSGKTTLSSCLVPLINSEWLNADKLRKESNNWDFSEKGREDQAKRMNIISSKFINEGKVVVADFVCPTPKLRKIFNPDFVIWMNTIKKSRYDDTNQMFVNPKNYDFKINTFDAVNWSKKIAIKIKSHKKFKKTILR